MNFFIFLKLIGRVGYRKKRRQLIIKIKLPLVSGWCLFDVVRLVTEERETQREQECVCVTTTKRSVSSFLIYFLFYFIFSPERFAAAVIATAAPLTAFGRRRRALSATPFPASSDLPFYPLQLTPPTQFLPPANLSKSSSVYGTTTTTTTAA